MYDKDKNHLLIKQLNQYPIINLDEVLYIEADGNYSIIHKDDNNQYIIAKKIEEIERLLPLNSFARIHRSFIVNISKISFLKCENNKEIQIFFFNKKFIKFSLKKRKEIMEVLEKYCIRI